MSQAQTTRPKKTLESMRAKGKLPNLEDLRQYVDLSGYSNAAWKYGMKEAWVRQLLDGAPGPTLPAEVLPVSEVWTRTRMQPDVLTPLEIRSTFPPRKTLPKEAASKPSAADLLPPRKPAAPVGLQERQEVMSALRAAGRPMSKSLLLCRLRGWKLERLELVLTDLARTNRIYSPDAGRYSVTPEGARA